MKKAKLSKFLSLVLTLCMAFQLAPVIAPQAQAADVADIEISLLNIANGGAKAESISAFENYNSGKSADLVWYYDKDGSDVTATQVFYTQTRTVINKDEKFQLKFYAKKAGSYNLKASAYILPTVSIGVEGVSYTVTLAEVASAETVNVGTVNVYEGWNTLTVTGTLATQKDVWLGNFTLTYVSELEPSTVTVDINSSVTWTTKDSDNTFTTEFNNYNQDKSLRTWRFDSSSCTAIVKCYAPNGATRIDAQLGQAATFEFYAPAAGEYAIAINHAGSGNHARILVNGHSIGMINTGDSGTSGKTIGAAYLTAGWNTLTISAYLVKGNFDLMGFTATPVGDEQLPFVIDFLAPVVSGWGAGNSAAFQEFSSYNEDYTVKTWRFLKDEGKYSPNGAQVNNVVRIAIEKNTGSAIFEFDAPSDGYYQMDMYYYASAITAAFAIDGQKVATLDASGSEEYLSKTIGGVYLEKGTHKLAIYNEGSDEKDIYLRTLVFTPATAPAVEAPAEDDVFGSKYAYVYKTENGYAINFVGGIKGTNYSEVGFELVVDGTAKDDAKTTAVYKKIMLNSTAYAPSDFAAGDDGYIFYVTDTIDADAVNVTIKPYAIGEDGKVYRDDDKSYTINLASLK